MDDLISRQAAVDAIRKWKKYETTNGLVGIIERLPSAHPEKTQLSREDTTSDCISRHSAINIVYFECGEWEGLANRIVKDINDLPSVQPDNSCDGCIYENADDGVLVPCGFCKRSHPDNYCERRTDG